ncbi:MAG: FAD-dependent oxidoreductase, partial [Burkholderiales bacterium]
MTAKTWDVAVVGAGSFGAWTALRLREKGLRVVLVDQYGPGNARSSSGGESRIIRMGYGPDELYTRLALSSLAAWRSVLEGTERLFHETGVLWLARAGDRYALDTLATLARLGLPHERLSAADIRRRYPQFALGEDVWGMIEPASGALIAGRAVQAVVRAAIHAGVEYRPAAIAPPTVHVSLEAISASDGSEIRAAAFVFACGAWLPKLFPERLGARI